MAGRSRSLPNASRPRTAGRNWCRKFALVLARAAEALVPVVGDGSALDWLENVAEALGK